MTNIDSLDPPAVPPVPQKCTNPKVELEVQRQECVLKHRRENRLKIVIKPSSCRGEEFRIEIKRASGGGWLPLSKKRSLMWLTRIAGKFKLRGVAKIEGSEVMSDETDVEVQFPTFAQITGDSKANGVMRREWAKTLKDCTPTRRRERGFFIRLDTRANKYIATNHVEGRWVTATEGAEAALGARPDDDPVSPEANAEGAKYVVASFHTHTPATYRNFGSDREIGPSDPDNSNNTRRQLPGVVYDYEAVLPGPTPGIHWARIPEGHPEGAAAMLYHSKGVD